MRLTIITTVLAIGALTACNPLDQPPRFSPASVDVSEPPAECPTVEACATPAPQQPVPVPDLTSAECVAVTAEECTDPAPTPPNPTNPPTVGSAEGGSVDPGAPGTPYTGE